MDKPSLDAPVAGGWVTAGWAGLPKLIESFERLLPEATTIIATGRPISDRLYASVRGHIGSTTYRLRGPDKPVEIGLPYSPGIFDALAGGLSAGGDRGLTQLRVFAHRVPLAVLRAVGPAWWLRLAGTIPPLRIRRVSRGAGFRAYRLAWPNPAFERTRRVILSQR